MEGVMIYEDDEALDESFVGAEPASAGGQTGTVALAVLAGAAIGAVVALMMTPKTGSEMRRAVRKRADSLRNTAGSVLDETVDDVGRELRRRSRQLRRKLDRMA
jgi:gas vesicle protein